MRTLGTYFVLFAAMLALAVTCVWIAGCDDKPTEPSPAKDYLFYMISTDSLVGYYAYSPDSGFVDSARFAIEYPIETSLSTDGKTMYIPTEFQGIFAVDLETKTLSQFWPTKGTVTPSPDGRYLAVDADGDLYLLNASDLTVVYHDTTRIRQVRFSRDSRSLYAIGVVYPDWPDYVYKLNLDGTFSVERTWFSHISPQQICPSPNETLWFLLTKERNNPHCGEWFDVYDVEGDSLIYSEDVNPGRGNIQVSRNGRFVYYTNPSPPVVYEGCKPPSYRVMVYDVLANQARPPLSTTGVYGEGTEIDSMTVDRMAISPDGRWILGMFLMEKFVLIDAINARIAKLEAPDTSLYLSRPMAQLLR